MLTTNLTLCLTVVHGQFVGTLIMLPFSQCWPSCHRLDRFIGGPENWGRTSMMWNYALNSVGQPILPGSNSCGGGCRGVVTIPGDGGFSLNEECEYNFPW